MIVSANASDVEVDIVPKFHMTRGLGFPLNPDDNYLMYLHCLAAAEYMKTYGQAPAQPMIDLSHYVTSKTKG